MFEQISVFMAFEELQIDKVLFWRKINKKPHKTKQQQQQQQQKAKRQGYSIDWLSFLISINKKKKKKILIMVSDVQCSDVRCTNSLVVSDYFVGLALKGLISIK